MQGSRRFETNFVDNVARTQRTSANNSNIKRAKDVKVFTKTPLATQIADKIKSKKKQAAEEIAIRQFDVKITSEISTDCKKNTTSPYSKFATMVNQMKLND